MIINSEFDNFISVGFQVVEDPLLNDKVDGSCLEHINSNRSFLYCVYDRNCPDRASYKEEENVYCKS